MFRQETSKFTFYKTMKMVNLFQYKTKTVQTPENQENNSFKRKYDNENLLDFDRIQI